MVVATILPAATGLRIDCLKMEQDGVRGVLVSTTAIVPCPVCEVESSKVQGHYVRTVAELPWSGVAVQFTLNVRRFYCRNKECARKIFTERLAGVVRPYGRKTVRLEKSLRAIAYAEGGETGARTAKELGMQVSPDTLLNQLRKVQLPSRATPKVLGVDDWAMRKGQRYGTILVDLEQHIVIDLLPDRDAETFSNWLKDHPGVDFISRDRGQSYAQGGKTGAPDAIHIADRFHLLQNLTDAVEQLLIHQYKSLQATAQVLAIEGKAALGQDQAEPLSTTSTTAIEIGFKPIADTQSKTERATTARRARRLIRYQQVVELAEEGVGCRAISRYTGISRVTVKRFLKANGFPEIARSKRSSKIDPYLSYLQQRWREGCYNCIELWQEIKGLGFAGSIITIRRAVADWRKQLPKHLRRQRGPIPKPTTPVVVVPSTRRTVFWLLGLSKEKDEAKKIEHQNFIAKLCEISIEVKQAQNLGKQFIEMVRERKIDSLDPWLANAIGSGLPELNSFGEGLKRDLSAVRASLQNNWSNGQTEGQVNRLKFLKRQMYGRAKLDLLKARVLHPT